MAKKYLDTDGLTRVFSKMKALVSDAENAKRAKAAVITTAGSGSAYTATVPGVTELYTGLTITIIPHTASTTATPTLNVNRLGAKNIRQQLSTSSGSTASGESSSWLTKSKPITVRYDGAQWIVVGLTRPVATNLYGTVPVSSGGTGKTTAAEARTSLGAEGKHSTVTATLAAASWSSNAQTVTVSGVTSSNTVIISPAPASQEAYTKAGVYCSDQAANSLTFSCKTAPTAALTVNVVILGG